MRAFHPPIAAGADRPVADPGGDPLWRGQGSEQQRSRSMAGANFSIPDFLAIPCQSAVCRVHAGLREPAGSDELRYQLAALIVGTYRP